MLHIDYEVDEALPRLAWCATLKRGASRLSVRCGAWVERFDTGFFEGAWSADFEAGRFDTALTCCGTGARLIDSSAKIRFVTPTHTLHALYSLRRGATLWVSNSLCFLLNESGIELDACYRYYEADLMTVMFGLARYRTFLPTATDDIIQVHYHCTLEVCAALHMAKLDKPNTEPFQDFEHYLSYLQQQLEAVVRNATAPKRRVQFPPLATLSSGYDSPACAVLARAAGCSRGFTFTEARQGPGDRNDSGKSIGEALGFTVTELDTEDLKRRRQWLTEAEFIASGYGADDVVFAAIEAILSGQLLVIGTHGDKVWDTHPVQGGETLVRGDPSGASLSEFRLRIGLVLLPAPFIGATQYSSILRTSTASEMQPWSIVDSGYNRPIPRRIVESEGIPRAWFGQLKKAIATPHHTTGTDYAPLEEVFSAELVERFRNYLRSAPCPRRTLKELRHKLLRQCVTRYASSRLASSESFLRLLRALRLEGSV